MLLFFFSSIDRHSRLALVSWAGRGVKAAGGGVPRGGRGVLGRRHNGGAATAAGRAAAGKGLKLYLIHI